MAPYVDLYPRPNREVFGDTGLFVFANDTVGDEDFLTTRIDHSVSDRDKLFLRYTFDDGARAQETAFALGKLRNSTRNQSAVIEETHYASASLVNTARIGFLRTYTVSGGTETNNPATDDAALAFLPGGSVVGILDVSGLTDFPGGSGAPRRRYPRVQLVSVFRRSALAPMATIPSGWERPSRERSSIPTVKAGSAVTIVSEASRSS